MLIVYSDSKNTEWSFCDSSDDVQTMISSAISPMRQTAGEMLAVIKHELKIPKANVKEVFFYGECYDSTKQKSIISLLQKTFKTKKIEIGNDLTAATRGLFQDRAGIACVIDTSSCSCLYNGVQIVKNIFPMGFILGDEGSGAYMGRRLIGDIFKRFEFREIADAFFEEYTLTYNQILAAVYYGQNADRFLSQFTIFISRHIKNPLIDQLVRDSLSQFISRNVLEYNDAKYMTVSFMGDVAYRFSTQLQDVLSGHGLKLGTIVRSPMEGLIKYHTKSH